MSERCLADSPADDPDSTLLEAAGDRADAFGQAFGREVRAVEDIHGTDDIGRFAQRLEDRMAHNGKPRVTLPQGCGFGVDDGDRTEYERRDFHGLGSAVQACRRFADLLAYALQF